MTLNHLHITWLFSCLHEKFRLLIGGSRVHWLRPRAYHDETKSMKQIANRINARKKRQLE